MIEFGINNLKDLAEFVSYLITIITLIGLWITYRFSKKQLHFPAMAKCMNVFREMTKEPLSDFSEVYIELVNEEFFYIENDYIPIEVGMEWIDGMIDYLPFFDYNENFIESQKLESLRNKIKTLEILTNYPRVSKAIHLSIDIDFDKIFNNDTKNKNERRKERDKLIFEIINNLQITWWKKKWIRYQKKTNIYG